MHLKLSPKQTLLLWQLLVTGEEPAQSKTKPELTATERKALVDSGLIELVPHGRAKHLVLTDKAWDWASTQAVTGLSKSDCTACLLQALIGKLQHYLQTNNLPLAEILTTHTPTPPALSTSVIPNAAPTQNTNGLATEIRTAYHLITKGKTGVRVRLAELHSYLTGNTKEAVDNTLRQMQLAGELILMPLDDPKGIRAEDEQAAVHIGGDRRHVVYMKG